MGFAEDWDVIPASRREVGARWGTTHLGLEQAVVLHDLSRRADLLLEQEVLLDQRLKLPGHAAQGHDEPLDEGQRGRGSREAGQKRGSMHSSLLHEEKKYPTCCDVSTCP